MMTNYGPSNRRSTLKTNANESNDTPEHVCPSRTVETTHNTSNDTLNKVVEIGIYLYSEKKSSLVNDRSTVIDTDHPIDKKISFRDNTDNGSTVKWRFGHFEGDVYSLVGKWLICWSIVLVLNHSIICPNLDRHCPNPLI